MNEWKEFKDFLVTIGKHPSGKYLTLNSLRGKIFVGGGGQQLMCSW